MYYDDNNQLCLVSDFQFPDNEEIEPQHPQTDSFKILIEYLYGNGTEDEQLHRCIGLIKKTFPLYYSVRKFGGYGKYQDTIPTPNNNSIALIKQQLCLWLLGSRYVKNILYRFRVFCILFFPYVFDNDEKSETEMIGLDRVAVFRYKKKCKQFFNIK
jgi:hypothetical protein